MHAITIGLDIAKSVFQVHGEDAQGKVVVQKKLRRGQVVEFFPSSRRCLIGIEACGTSHHWARDAARAGPRRTADPAAYVKPFVQAQQERCTRCGGDLLRRWARPDMRFVAIKSVEQQASRGAGTRRAICW